MSLLPMKRRSMPRGLKKWKKLGNLADGKRNVDPGRLLHLDHDVFPVDVFEPSLFNHETVFSRIEVYERIEPGLSSCLVLLFICALVDESHGCARHRGTGHVYHRTGQGAVR